MNRLATVLLVLGVVGCSASPETIDTSGTHPTLGAAAPMTQEAKDAEIDTGRLVVLTPKTLDPDPIDFSSPPVSQHTGYTVYTEDGHKVAHEGNHGLRTLGPEERKLAPGRYFVRLDQDVPGREFWVSIEKGKVTRVQNELWNGSPATVK
jgi:hypothetical protein